MVYKSIPEVGMQHRLRCPHIFFKGFASLLLLCCFPLPDIGIISSPLHDLHVLMVLKAVLNLWTTYLDLIAKGCERGVLLGYLGNSEIGNWKPWKLW